LRRISSAIGVPAAFNRYQREVVDVAIYTRDTPEVQSWVKYLQDRWSGQVSRATASEVVREALRRAYEQEKKKEEKSRDRS
jgi:hypothetical protein